MTEISSPANIKEKINAVRSVVPNKSNNEIVLVLQQFDNNVNKAVQAFMDGSALQFLKEWNMTGKKKNSKRKRSKSKQHHRNKDTKGREDGTEKVSLESQKVNDCRLNGCAKDTFPGRYASEKSKNPHEEKIWEYKNRRMARPEIADKKEESTKASIEPEQNSRELPDPFKYSPPLQCNVGSTKSKVPTTTIKSLHVPASDLEMKAEDLIQKRGLNIEKSVKDLQRCTVSLTRYRMMVKEEVDNSVKKIKAAFSELHNCIIDKEVVLMAEVNKVKQEAMDILTARQKKAEELKRLTDLASQMAETQLAELRAEIKHFVSERKYDEELGRAARFSCDTEQLKMQILQCGEIFHPKNNYSSRTPSSMFLQSEILKSVTSTQNKCNQKYSNQIPAKTSDHKTAITKVSSQVLPVTQSSSHVISTNKQNVSSGPRRRFHAHYHGIRIDSSLKPQNPGDEPDQSNPKSHSRHEYRRQHHHSFRPKNRGMVKTQEQPTPIKNLEKGAYPEKKQQKHTISDPTEPSPLCSNIARGSPCNLCPPRIETSGETPVLSVTVPAVTLVA
ncbi:SPATS2-like protein isoform X1 [Pseudonaja textilis]|uniref:SPATS2-like protein isoform X1 n=1 Tax=Pseudonaja textilis TaxID=8673 RepID=UPI000EAABF14|nr:SPATS2-like protein isoform X1 [Pseudonaja textilis]XP_026552615.1 SPATS2-like protein isoform X1 [Pseudonaja textilis]XP_026552616.1 SPATS2-like protein isoform X1 [Pseudonaja textilis]XP_026552619.1 SPATS2-like protein isoform X1 [Pseudonaja textilis]